MKFSVDSKTAKIIKNSGSYVTAPSVTVRYFCGDKFLYSPVISKRQGCAAERNRVKRKIRSIFAELENEIPKGSYLLYYKGKCSFFKSLAFRNDIKNLLIKKG